MNEILGGMFYGAFILFPMIVILIGGLMALVGAALNRPHDPRPNGWMALMHYNQLKHIERMHAPAQFTGTVLPPAQPPHVVDGTVVSEWPTRAMVAASWRTGVQIGGENHAER